MSDEIRVEEVREEIAEVKKESTEIKLQSDFSTGIYGSSDNFKLAYQMAKGLSQSTLVPIQFQKNPANCMIALEQAQRLNISPMAVMQNLYVVQGRPSFSSSFLIGLINASGKFDFELQFDEEEKGGKPYACTCWTEKNGRKVSGIKITMDMADKEGWTKKNGSKWITIPQVMLRYRSAAFFARLNCPELSLGLYTKDELDELNEVPAPQKKASLNSLLDDTDTIEVVDSSEV